MEVTPEEKHEHYKFAAAIYHDKRVVGHAPKNLSKQFYQFLSLPSSFSCEVTGKWVNIGGCFRWLSFIKEVWFYMALFVYGLEIHVKYKFIGPEKAINLMKMQVNKTVTEHCMS